MIWSRGLTFIRLNNQIVKNYFLQNGRQNCQKQMTRTIHDVTGKIYYRQAPEPVPSAERFAEVIGGVVWWWLIWHYLTDYHELIGSSPYPDVESLTDEELGIPPDDED